MPSDTSDDLFPEIRNPEGDYVINERCLLRTRGAHCVVLVSGMSLAQYAVGDCMSEALAMVNLVDQGWADQDDVAKAFGCSVRTVRRHQRRFEEGGLPALGRSGGYPRGRARMPSTRQRSIQQLKVQGHSHNEIARRLGITVRAVRKTLRRLGWKPETAVQPELPLQTPESANSSSPAPGPVPAWASAPRSGFPPSNCFSGVGSSAMACSTNRKNSLPRERDVRRLNRNVNSQVVESTHL